MIARTVQLARSSSSAVSIALLVGFNLVPLVGVLFGRWNVATLLVLYWVENGIVGLLNIVKMLLAEGPAPVALSANVRLNGQVVASKILMVLFFCIHYGLFWVVHGVFVLTLPMFFGAGGPDVFGDAPTVLFDPNGLPIGGPTAVLLTPIRSGPDLTAVAWGALGLAISHTVSLVVNFIGRGEYRKVSPAQQMAAPYGRLVVLHVTILLGAFVSLSIGSPIGAVIILVILKTALDLSLHLREHRRLTERAHPT